MGDKSPKAKNRNQKQSAQAKVKKDANAQSKLAVSGAPAGAPKKGR